MKSKEIREIIIIGAGASGLMCAASPYFKTGGGDRLILEGSKRAGIKLLMSGGGRCNITHDARGADLIKAYGDNGRRFRKIMYRYSPDDLKEYLHDNGIETVTEADGRVFPASGKASDILDMLLGQAEVNGFNILTEVKVTGIGKADGYYEITAGDEVFRGRTVIIATGGMSYPGTGSDGEMLGILERDLDLSVTELRPALVPVIPEGYPYGDLSGISVDDVRVTVHRDGRKSVSTEGSVLFTHKGFSGPAVLDISEHAEKGSRITLNYTLNNDILPRRLLKAIEKRAKGSPKRLERLLGEDMFVVAGNEGFDHAMVTKGGVDIGEINILTMEVNDHKGLYVIGEALDVNGISGGYNLQICWSTAQAAAGSIKNL